jgi:hypothetical protein
MTELAQRLKDRFFRQEDHPYRIFEREIDALLRPEHVLLRRMREDSAGSGEVQRESRPTDRC